MATAQGRENDSQTSATTHLFDVGFYRRRCCCGFFFVVQVQIILQPQGVEGPRLHQLLRTHQILCVMAIESILTADNLAVIWLVALLFGLLCGCVKQRVMYTIDIRVGRCSCLKFGPFV